MRCPNLTFLMETESSGIRILSSEEGGQSFVMFGAGALSTTVLLSLVYVFMKKS